MDRRAGQIPEGLRQAQAALRGPPRPMTAAERAEFEALKAREMAKAEALRDRSPQIPLDFAA